MNVVGMDLGTQRVKVVVLKDGKVASRGQAPSGFDSTKAAEQAVADALREASLELSDIAYFVATGSAMAMAPYARSTISMMGADAKAGVFLFPKTRTIIDVGAEEARAIKCDEKGIMVDFVECFFNSGVFHCVKHATSDYIVDYALNSPFFYFV